MDLTATPLDQLGSHAHGHYRAAEKAKEKAEQNYVSAGIYLKEAKRRVLNTRGLTFERWLKDHCPISRSRAYEVIAIADGTKTVEEVREATNERKKKHRAEASVRSGTANRSEKPNENNDRPTKDVVREAENIANAHHDALRKEVLALVKKANGEQLLHIRKAILDVLS